MVHPTIRRRVFAIKSAVAGGAIMSATTRIDPTASKHTTTVRAMRHMRIPLVSRTGRPMVRASCGSKVATASTLRIAKRTIAVMAHTTISFHIVMGPMSIVPNTM